MHFILQWIDFIWLPLMMVVVSKNQRIFAAGFFAACAFMMRMEVELMTSTGFVTGMLPLMQSHVFYRGIVVYSLFYGLYLALCLYSPNARNVILMAASITIFFAASVVSMLVMLL